MTILGNKVIFNGEDFVYNGVHFPTEREVIEYIREEKENNERD